jgi:AcrR family transcriptional regulator
MPKIVDAKQYRRELLQKSFDLFAQKGYANVTTRQIAKELDISTGALYHYFPSKKVLFEQLVEEMGRRDVVALTGLVVGRGTLNERIAVLGKFLLEREDYFVKQTAIWMDFCMNVDASEIFSNAVFNRVDDRYRQAIAEALELKNPSITQFVWTLINGILMEQVGNRDSRVFAEQIYLFVDMLIAYFERFPQ